MKPINYIHSSIFIALASERGRGVFTSKKLRKKTLIEIAPVIVLSAAERKIIDETLLHDYIFEWGADAKKCCMALGYVPLYNHSYESNCEYEMEYDKEIISIRTTRTVQEGEELFINYNGDWDNDKRIWFSAK